ncbi:hypothetical protein F66182_6264 [Fusarium sp. NRRL 66182]|nr:hypothetical protein F66182_6264 [Fusarium sp. NRRL 66182]
MASTPPTEHGKEAVVDVSESRDVETGEVKNGGLQRDLKNRHMQMIAIGGAIGAGLFVGSGGALQKGGPAALLIGYLIIGIMLLCTCLALAEMAVLYPVNGAFFTYIVRFVDPSWGFAIGWQYALAWLTVLPFELIAASITIKFWREDINMAVWVSVFLVVLIIVQVFGVRGYGEVEFVLSIIKICACVGFIILGIVINCGGVGDQGYIGVKYWKDPGAFTTFKGFASVFVVAAFSFGGTEMVGLAAAESADPRKSIPMASKQVFWRIAIFYILNLFIVGLILPYDDERLMGASGANTKASPFVLAIQDAGIKVLPSIMNGVITIAVLSVANSCTFGSTRTIQAMAERSMAPSFFKYIDSKGRPLYCVLLQIAFGLLAYIGAAPEGGEIFGWLLALTGLGFLFVWGSICLAHIRMRAGMKAQGIDLGLIPYKTPFGVAGSWLGFGLNILALIATFYVALFPASGGSPTAEGFFGSYLAFFVVFFLYVGYKVGNRKWQMLVRPSEMDLASGAVWLEEQEPKQPFVWSEVPMKLVRGLF